MKSKLCLALGILLLLALNSLPVLAANTVSGFANITADQSSYLIQTLTWDSIEYDVDELVLGTTSGGGIGNKGNADNFLFDNAYNSLDSAAYFETTFGGGAIYDTFFVFEGNGNDDCDWYGIRNDDTLTTGVWTPGSVGTDTTYDVKIGNGNQKMVGFVFETDELVKGIRIQKRTSSEGFDAYSISALPSAVPVPGAVWLLGSGIVGLVVIRRRKQ